MIALRRGWRRYDCPACGARQPPWPAPATWPCPQCGIALESRGRGRPSTRPHPIAAAARARGISLAALALGLGIGRSYLLDRLDGRRRRAWGDDEIAALARMLGEEEETVRAWLSP